jgi:cytochrome c553
LLDEFPGAEKQAALEEGQSLFRGLCSGCHGGTGRGGKEPDLTDDRWIHGSGDDIARVIRNGVPKTTMKKLGESLKEEQIRKLILYIRSLARAPGETTWKPYLPGSGCKCKLTIPLRSFNIEEQHPCRTGTGIYRDHLCFPRESSSRAVSPCFLLPTKLNGIHAPNRALKFTYSLWFGSVRFLDNDPKRPVQGEISVDPSSAVLLETTEGGHGANHDGRLTR